MTAKKGDRKIVMTVDLTQPIEKRAKAFFDFLSQGIDRNLTYGTEFLSAGQHKEARERFTAASTTLYVMETFCNIFKEVEGTADFLERKQDIINRAITEAAAMSIPEEGMFRC